MCLFNVDIQDVIIFLFTSMFTCLFVYVTIHMFMITQFISSMFKSTFLLTFLSLTIFVHLQASTQRLRLQSPNYPAPFPAGMECNWLVQAPPGGTLYLQFVDSFAYDCLDTCDGSFVELKVKRDLRPAGYRFCCAQTPQSTFVAEAGQLVLLHRASGPLSTGFRALVWADRDPQPEQLRPTTSPPAPTSSRSVNMNCFEEFSLNKAVALRFFIRSSSALPRTEAPLFTLPTILPTSTSPPHPAAPWERSNEVTEEVDFTTTTSTPSPTRPTSTATSPTARTTTPAPTPSSSTFGFLPGEFLGGALGPDNNLGAGGTGGEEEEKEEQGLKQFTLLPTLLPTLPAITPLGPLTTSTAAAGGDEEGALEVVTPPDRKCFRFEKDFCKSIVL